jgi:hypothetical protein
MIQFKALLIVCIETREIHVILNQNRESTLMISIKLLQTAKLGDNFTNTSGMVTKSKQIKEN